MLMERNPKIKEEKTGSVKKISLVKKVLLYYANVVIYYSAKENY